MQGCCFSHLFHLISLALAFWLAPPSPSRALRGRQTGWSVSQSPANPRRDYRRAHEKAMHNWHRHLIVLARDRAPRGWTQAKLWWLYDDAWLRIRVSILSRPPWRFVSGGIGMEVRTDEVSDHGSVWARKQNNDSHTIQPGRLHATYLAQRGLSVSVAAPAYVTWRRAHRKPGKGPKR